MVKVREAAYTEVKIDQVSHVKVHPAASFQRFAHPVLKLDRLPIILHEYSNSQGEAVLYRINDEHGRSTVVGSPQSARKIFTIGSRAYSAIVLKGNEQRQLSVTKQSNEEYGLNFHGLSYATDRQIQRLGVVTAFCERLGIKSERITQIYEYDELPWGFPPEAVSIDEYKARLVAKFGEALPELEAALKEIKFIAWERAMPVPERIYDLAKAATHEDFAEKFGRVIQTVNQVEKRQGEDAFTLDSVSTYITEYLATEVAAQFGKIHRRGVIARYCNTQNTTADGGLCDLEDMMGEALGLGHPRMNEYDLAADLRMFLDESQFGITTIIQTMMDKGFMPRDDKATAAFVVSFFQSYAKARWHKPLEEVLPKVSALVRHMEGGSAKLIAEALGQSGFEINITQGPTPLTETEQQIVSLYRDPKNTWGKIAELLNLDPQEAEKILRKLRRRYILPPRRTVWFPHKRKPKLSRVCEAGYPVQQVEDYVYPKLEEDPVTVLADGETRVAAVQKPGRRPSLYHNVHDDEPEESLPPCFIQSIVEGDHTYSHDISGTCRRCRYGTHVLSGKQK